MLANGLGSIALADLNYKLQEVSGKIDDVQIKYKRLEAEMMAKHMEQDAEHTVQNPTARAKRQRQEIRQCATSPAMQVAEALFAPALAPAPEPATTEPAPEPTIAAAPAPEPATTTPAPEPTTAPAPVPEPVTTTHTRS